MKFNGINWRLIWQFGIILFVAAFLFFFIQRMDWKMSGESDRVTAEQFASFYLTTPISKMNDLRGWGTCSYSQTSPTGYINFDCDEIPVLSDAQLYKSGGDILELTDKFLRQFGKNAWPLLHSSDVSCLRMKEGPSGPTRFLLHNAKTKKYFFARL